MLYRSRFVQLLNTDGTNRSRICVAARTEDEDGLFTTITSIKRISVHLIFAVVSTDHLQFHTQDVPKDSVLSRALLKRPIFMKAPCEMRLAKTKVLKVVRQFHGMPDSPIHWFKTYSDYHKTYLKMIQSKLDLFGMIRRNEGKLEGILGILADDPNCAVE